MTQSSAPRPARTEEEADLAPSHLSDGEFQTLLRDTTPQLRAFGRMLARCPARGDDLAQEAMLRAWSARASFRRGTSFRAWTFTILRNLFLTEARRAVFHGVYDELDAERRLRVEATQSHGIELTDVLRALDTLPETHRHALLLVAVADMPYDEAAASCGVAVGTIKSRVCRARAMLAHRLASGQLPDHRHNFVMTNDAVDALFAQTRAIANRTGAVTSLAA